mgnify:CR=1 FL=1
MNATNQTTTAFASLTINGEPKQEIQVSRALRPFKNLDEIDLILDDEYHSIHAINKVVLDVVPVEQNQIKIGLDWLFEVENWDLDGMITINYPNNLTCSSSNDDEDLFALASLKIENDTWIITIYDSDDIIMEFLFKLD